MSLLTQRNFLPLFLAQIFGVFNDNLFKSALTMLVTYKLAAGSGYNAGVLVTLGGGIFIFPYVIFSGLAGQLADKFEKSRLIIYIKLTEILLMATGLFVLRAENLWGLFILLLLMGIHSTFFGPIKYGILPQALPKSQLLAANGLFEGSTFIAILAGTMYGGALVLYGSGAEIVGFTGLAVAVAGLITALLIPKSPGVDPTLTLNPNIFTESVRVVSRANQGHGIMGALMYISWFWLMGAVILSLIPVYGAEILHGDSLTTTFLLSLFSIGIAIGSIMCQKLFKNEVTLAYVPLSAAVLTASGLVMALCSKALPAVVSGAPLRTITELLSYPIFWPIVVAFVTLAMAGGVFTVPLYAFIQAVGESSSKSRLIAANNVLNAVFMVAGAIVSSIMLAVGISLLGVLTCLMLANLLVAIISCSLMPRTMQQRVLRAILGYLFRVKIVNPQYLSKLPERVLVIANHQSFLDAAFLAIFIPTRLTFAIDVAISRKWWVKPALTIVKAFPMDSTNPYAIRNLINLVKANEPCMVFPEGRLTKTGALMKVYDGTAMVALSADATLLPVFIEGLQYSKFTRLKGVLRLRWFPQVTLTIHPPRKLDVAPELRGRQRRVAAGQLLQRQMVEMHFASAPLNKTLFTALLEARHIHGRKHIVLNDINLQPLTYGALAARSILLGGVLKREGLTHTNPLRTVGLLLPNANAAAATFFALQAAHAVPAMLNFTAGPENIISACTVSLVTTILTSRTFVEKGKLENLITRLQDAGLNIVYLEDVRAKIRTSDKLKLIAAAYFPHKFYRETLGEPASPAAVLFTSGSEGKPKGVVLSHSNFIANVAQARAVVDFNPTDTLLNALPMFHSFGLTGGTLLPVLSGVPTFLYPSPLHYRIVPEMAYNFNATIMFGTDTFLTGYARYANPYDFYRMRYIFAGAEKVRTETRKLWFEKFGVRIMEGYGATETSPVLALNTPMAFRDGAVGKLVPGMEYKLEEVEGLEGGNLTVRGPNVMLGYLRVDAPGKIQPPKSGWYETGDVVTIDDMGFITIAGRLKRFAKIGGEMVSLTAAEAMAHSCWPNSQNAVVALPDDRKGEQLILFTTQTGATKDQLRQHSRAKGGTELALPRQIHIIDKLPTLATGKIDYVSLTGEAQKLA